MKVSFVSILTTAALFISTVQCTSYNLWSAERKSGRVTFIPYTQQQRESVMDNVDRMMKMWVNSDSKQSHYDGKANPYPDLDIFRETYAGMTDEQFNLDLARIFNKMRDSHTLFYKSGPYGCFSVSTGLFFKSVDDSLVSSTPPKVRVVGITSILEVLDLIRKALSPISVGDELLTVNGLSFDEWYEQNKFILGFGANDSGGHSGAFKYLAGISGSSNILPEADSITFQLKRLKKNQAVYTVTIPYVALSNDECWDLSSNLYKELTGITLPGTPAPTSFRYKRSVSVNGASLSRNSMLQRSDADIHKRSYWESAYFKTTDIDGLTWDIWKNGERNMGVIKIESFILVLKNTKEYTSFLFLALTIRNLLVKQLKDTDAILFDIRGNDGGSISGADGIIQLFKSDVTASQFRYLKNEVTRDIFYKGLSSKNPWSKAWDATSDTSRYSGLVSLYDSSILNTLGQVYFNPVGVYTNGACYSACEVFAAQIQDHGIGTVFGEDETTGGGGASVLSNDEHYFTNRPLEHSMDPFTKKLTGKTPSQKFYTRVSVGARQLVRGGNYAGQLVEDEGVKSEVIVRSIVADISPSYRSVSAYDCMADYLGDVAKRKMDGKVYFESEPYDRATFEDSIDISFVASGVDEIIVVHQGEILGSWKGKLSTVRQSRDITVKTPTGLHSHLITFIGKKRRKQIFKTHRQITRIPTSDDRVSMMTANSYTASGLSPSVGVYSFGSTLEQEGWNFNNGEWVIGDGMSDYYGYMYSIIQVWLTAPVGSTISVSIDAIVDTYEDGGVFSLNMMDDSGKVVPMVSSPSKDGLTRYQSTTGRNQVIKGTYSFTVTTEKNSLDMGFVSYNAESPFSIRFNSIVITKDQGIFNWLNRHRRRYFKP
ncbi:hypothetical protein BASA50_000767 [Batrachochytrium salamandrivorans]|uniref:Tail specific protease domain-containing protein n=1 Tax=Batrachochytrium salamandrivorans TaxID=1357716 RepID=A0ABQ8ESV0_9FUNG|nr:hypothetical protein BASA50_000767 [Batrachochytrium salamandrivorans]